MKRQKDFQKIDKPKSKKINETKQMLIMQKIKTKKEQCNLHQCKSRNQNCG